MNLNRIHVRGPRIMINPSIVVSLIVLHVQVCIIPGAHSFFFEDKEHFHDCGGLLTSPQGKIESPQFPDAYPPDLDCVWEIRGELGSLVDLKSDWFDVEGQAECLWDSVEVLDGSDGEYGRQVHCGTSGFRFRSTSNIVKIHFKSDVSGAGAGFQIVYDIRSRQSESCNKTILEEGTVTSPNYPSNYPNDVTCFTVIRAPSDRLIQLNFTHFDVEYSPCDFDRLEVLAKDIYGTLTKQTSFCGKSLPPLYTSLSNEMTLKFISDVSLTSKGFSVSIRFVNGVQVVTGGGATTTAATTTTTTTTPPATTDTTTTTTTNTAKMTTTTRATESSSIRIDVDERTDVTSNGGCDVTIKGSIYDINSPLYPSPYGHNMDCVTRLRSDVKSTFVIKFVKFAVEESENCTYDSLSLFTAEAQDTDSKENQAPILFRRMCGTLPNDLIVSYEGHWLDLVFHSDQSLNDAGYLAHVVVTPIVEEAPRCPDVCKNGGTCAETLLPDGSVDWICLCTDDYSGVFCEILSPQSCLSIQCQNGATCRRASPRAVCDCPHGFAGILCEESVVISQQTPLFFTKMSGNLSLSLGSTAILECAVNDPEANVMWLFNDRILTSSDRSRGVDVHPGGVIVLREASDILSGRYTCMAVTPADLIERSTWISLIEPCSLEVYKGPSNMTVQVGQPALFQCHVPDADVILWRKDGDIVSQGPRKRLLVNNYLVINPVVETDAGQYTCAARGANGCFSKSSAYLTVDTAGHRQECGRARNPSTEADMVGRISSGREAPRGSAPWHVILRERKRNSTFCGGSLISSDMVVTAAHCVTLFQTTFSYPFHPRHIQIYIGTHHCDGHNGIYRSLKFYQLHEEFNNTTYNNDIAIFQLDRPVDYSDDVMPICLERPDFVEELMKPDRLGVITGCGGRHAPGVLPKFLLEVQIPFVPRDVCRERAKAVNTSFTEGMFCAGYARSMRGDACRGDSGGAFSLQFHGRAILVGIVSWGVGCDWENHYGYYTHVAKYYDWIMHIINTH